MATVVDAIIFSVSFWVLVMLFGTSSTKAGGLSFSLGGLGTLTYTVGVFAYYLLLEGYLGQTPGKMLLGIKVVREANGGVPGVGPRP